MLYAAIKNLAMIVKESTRNASSDSSNDLPNSLQKDYLLIRK
jgi:hypothetical protein